MNASLTDVDWSALPPPPDDGAVRHLFGARLPPLALPATNGRDIHLGTLSGRGVVYLFPSMTGRPDLPSADWNLIPGARGCTPQSCAFRDHFAELRRLGVDFLFGLSTQLTAEQREAAERLHLPFPILSDADLSLARALKLPTFEAAGRSFLKRMTFILQGSLIEHVIYPIFPPDRNADDVIAWLRAHAAGRPVALDASR
ncbi:MAG: peroxiredoxin [Pseudomonadota bacterium]|nr:peroxiredoxin [Pseudomonadota bacterium]